jgi:hypothetical protein
VELGVQYSFLKCGQYFLTIFELLLKYNISTEINEEWKNCSLSLWK